MKPNFHSLFYAGVLLVIFACGRKEDTPVPAVHEKESADSAYFISKVNDDTIYTGVPFTLEGKVKDIDHLAVNRKHLAWRAAYRMERSEKYTYIYDSITHTAAYINWDTAHTIAAAADTFKLSVTEPYVPQVIVLKASQPVLAGALQRKENARIDIQYLNSSSGLASSYANCILFGKNDLMWIGTQKGLCRYDGKYMTTYTTDEGLPDNSIMKLFEDSKGNLWIGTEYGGAAKYDGKNLTLFNSENGLSSNNISDFTEDQKGNIWFGMWGGGVARFDGKTIESFGREQGLTEARVIGVEVGPDDRLWIATNGKGLYYYDGKLIVNQKGAGMNDHYLTQLLWDSKGRFWLGNWNNMRYMAGDSLIQIRHGAEVKSQPATALIEDSRGNIWMGSGSGAFRYDGETVTLINELAGLTHEGVNDICEDAAGNIWFATGGGGICRYNPNSFTYFDESSGLNDKTVNAIAEMADGRIVFTTDKGLAFYDDTSFNRMYINDVSGFVGMTYALLQTRDNETWFSMLNDATYRLDGDSIRRYAHIDGLHDHNITAFAERSNGELWLGSWNVGISRLDEKGTTVFNANSGLHNFIITDLMVDTQDNLWISTTAEGITKYDGTHFMHITENEGLITNKVNGLYEDTFHNTWILQKEGISYISNGEVRPFADPALLPDKDVVSMIQDGDGNYWIFTANGLLYLKLKAGKNPSGWDLSDYDSKLFTAFDGLLGTDFKPGAVLIDSKNRIWFASGKGLMMKNLDSVDVSPKIPEVKLETIKINGRFIDYHNLRDTLYDSLFTDFRSVSEGIGEAGIFQNCPSSLTLPHDVNHLTFIYTAKGWHSDKITFSYRLSGTDEDWSKPSKETWAEYRNLAYGDYIFQLRAFGEAGAESEILEYHFTILPPWYHTWWARILFVLIFIIGVRTLVKWRTRQLIQKQVILENKVSERTAELDVKNRELVSQNSIIEEQRAEAQKRKEEIEKQHTLLEETHKEIKDSINYAKRIQEAILPTDELIRSHFPDHFILYQPKDIVAGDFYWIEKAGNRILFAAADCTGHGVPGAMVSVVCYNALNRAVREFGLASTEKVLDKTREIVLETFQLSNAQVNDGMDVALIGIEANQLTFSGANNTVTIVCKGEMFELDGDKQPIGNYKDAKPFTSSSFTLERGDMVYLFTDGYADQFGGPKGKKLKSKVLKEFLVSVSDKPLDVQKKMLLNYLEEWKGDLEQLDDISVFGFKF